MTKFYFFTLFSFFAALLLSGEGDGGSGGRGEGGGWVGYIIHYTLIKFNMADFIDLRKTLCDGLCFIALASFQTLGKVNRGNLFVVAK